MTRRRFLGSAALAAACGPRADAAPFNAPEPMDTILARIRPPRFPERDFPIARYGAREGGREVATPAITAAIAACSAAGGGRVTVPPGRFLTGAIHLKSNVDLHLEEGATLLFSNNPKDYLPLVYTRFEGTECMNYSPLIYAWEQTNIAITGSGVLDGQADADHWWPMKSQARRTELVAAADRDVPVRERIFGGGASLRPNFFQPYRSTNILVEGISIRRSPMWELNPVLCRNVTVRNVKISSHGPNNDGCDPESSTDVLIEDCDFDTGDDCIAIKSGRNRDGRRVGAPCENVIVRNCHMRDGHGGVSIGSEVSGGVRNVFMENNRMDSPHLERALRIKTNSWRGGALENFVFRNNTVGEVAEAVVDIDFYYPEGPAGPIGGGFRPVMRNVVVENISSERSKYALYLRGYPDAPISGVRVAGCTFRNVAQADVIENVTDLALENDRRNGAVMRRG
jgi:polygalacturonase